MDYQNFKIDNIDLIEFITESNKIENIFLPKEDFVKNIEKGRLEIIGQLEALYYAKAINYPFTHRSIQNIHYLLSKGILEPLYRGCYRQIEVRIGPYKKVKPYLILDLIARFCNMFNQEEDPLKCHYFFECAHPFFDFNGRTGRILLLAQQRLQGKQIKIIKYKNRDKYYKSIRKYEATEFKKIAFGETYQNEH